MYVIYRQFLSTPCSVQQSDAKALIDSNLLFSVHSITEYRARICKLVRGLETDFKESIPPAYVAWRAGTINLFLSVPSPHTVDSLKISALKKRASAL
jgi:hypothetical protein